MSLVPGIGSVLARNLIAYTGSVEAVFHEKKQNLLKIPGIGTNLVDKIQDKSTFNKTESELKFIEKYNIQPCFYLDKNYPVLLKEAADAPVLFYLKGNVDVNAAKILSIVGTRNASPYGKLMCEQLIAELSERKHNVLIVSGLAYGIDICAHKTALKYGLPTIGVLAHGLDSIYPVAHKKTAKEMLENGGLISEYTSETKLFPKNFVKRNRIIAGLSYATIVVESGKKGGSLISAQLANSYNRDVFAFPGRIGDKYSEGCNFLIKSNQAALVESVLDLEYVLGWEKEKGQTQTQRKLFYSFTVEEQKLVDVLNANNQVFIDDISLQTGIAVQRVSSLLLNLEFAGIVKSLPGKMYQLTY